MYFTTVKSLLQFTQYTHACNINVTRHEKTGLMYTKYTSSYYESYLLYCSTYLSSVNSTRFAMKCYINGDNFIRLLCLLMKLFKFEIQKCAQILCAHKPYFLMPGHKYRFTSIYTDKRMQVHIRTPVYTSPGIHKNTRVYIPCSIHMVYTWRINKHRLTLVYCIRTIATRKPVHTAWCIPVYTGVYISA